VQPGRQLGLDGQLAVGRLDPPRVLQVPSGPGAINGVVSPYSGRTASSTRTSTWPSVHSTMRAIADGE